MKPNLRVRKEQVELRTFEALAPLLGWEVVPNSIQQLKPPRPDILCEVKGAGAVGVELVSLDAPHTRNRLANMFSTPRAWRAALEQRPLGEQQALNADLSDVYISVMFAEQAGTRVRAAALHRLQSHLLGHPGWCGKVDADDIGDPVGFRSANILRGATSSGPHITAPSAGYWAPPQVNNVTKHLQGRYQVDGPLDLFAYSHHDEPDGAVGSLASIQTDVALHLPGSQFRRCHVFNLGFRQHVWSSE